MIHRSSGNAIDCGEMNNHGEGIAYTNSIEFKISEATVFHCRVVEMLEIKTMRTGGDGDLCRISTVFVSSQAAK